MRQACLADFRARLLQPAHEGFAQAFQLVDFLLLLVDHRIKFVDKILLTRELDFDIHETFFVRHVVYFRMMTCLTVLRFLQ